MRRSPYGPVGGIESTGAVTPERRKRILALSPELQGRDLPAWIDPEYEKARLEEQKVDRSALKRLSPGELTSLRSELEKESIEIARAHADVIIPKSAAQKLDRLTATLRVIGDISSKRLIAVSEKRRLAEPAPAPVRRGPARKKAISTEGRIREKGGKVENDGVRISGYLVTWATACTLSAVGKLVVGKGMHVQTEAIPFSEKEYLSFAKQNKLRVAPILELVSHMILAIEGRRYIYMDPHLMSDICALPLTKNPG